MEELIEKLKERGYRVTHLHRHRGDIKVTSQPGKACFEVWLPVNSEA